MFATDANIGRFPQPAVGRTSEVQRPSEFTTRPCLGHPEEMEAAETVLDWSTWCLGSPVRGFVASSS